MKKTKKELETKTNTKMIIDSKEGDIFLSGNDALSLFDVVEVIKAIGRGFNPDIAFLILKQDYIFGKQTKIFLNFLNSQPFLHFIQILTGINETLLGDPYFEGGGLHQIIRGVYLKVHADFNKHKLTGLDRRVNILIYLNKNWKELLPCRASW